MAIKSIKTHGQDAQRLAMLEIAIAQLEQHGAATLSMRRIAEQAGCSTTMLYTLFGGKEELANALYLEGFRRLEAALQRVQETELLRQILALNLMYRHFALEHPMFYSIMFERPIPEFEVSYNSRLQAWQSMMPLQTAIEKAMQLGVLPRSNPEDFAMQLWMTTHGLVSLELAGYITPELESGAVMLERMIAERLQPKSHLGRV